MVKELRRSCFELLVATGTTVCRDYILGYTASEGRIRIITRACPAL